MVAAGDDWCGNRTYGADRPRSFRWDRSSISSQLRRARFRQLRGPRLFCWANNICQPVRALLDIVCMECPDRGAIGGRSGFPRSQKLRAASGNVEVRLHLLKCVRPTSGHRRSFLRKPIAVLQGLVSVARRDATCRPARPVAMSDATGTSFVSEWVKRSWWGDDANKKRSAHRFK